ncbi:MAG: hypothetical protein ABI318_02130 [Chthoniobacteraceae bacterium]
MSLFQLDPQSIAARVRAANGAAPLPTLGASVVRGTVGFTLLSVAGFAPWPILDLGLRRGSEMQLYTACTAIFIGLSGPLLHRLIIGPGSLPRFYKVFTPAFIAYAAVWIAFWVWLRGSAGEIAGLLGGTAAMGAILAFAFDAQRSVMKVIAALFVLNAAGYFLGGWFEGKLAIHHRLAAMLLWGVCYGLGFGTGLGLAFHICQTRARAALGGR